MCVDNTEVFSQWISEEIGVDSYAPSNRESFTL